MNIAQGFLLVILAGIFQGSFLLPSTYTRNWDWAHNWLLFSFLGMFIINWLIALLSIGHLFSILSQIPLRIMVIVSLFGFFWGVGAILFGKAMDMLGMATGYPIIMGINATAGTLIPALIFKSGVFVQFKGVVIIIGAIISVIGIVVCAKAISLKNNDALATRSKRFRLGLVLAIVAGFTSCLPNIGASFCAGVADIAIGLGVDSTLAGNVVWVLFFSLGSIANIGYCLFMINKKKTFKALINEYKYKNWLLIGAMSAIWMGSFYCYGLGASKMGSLGLIAGWPLLVTLSIIIGNLWGMYRGEWNNSPKESLTLMRIGIGILVSAVVITGMSNW